MAVRASIIIASYNGSAYLKECLASLRQAVQPEDEIILVDDASQDGSAGLAQRLWPAARIICNHTNRGFAAACNQGAGEAAGEFLAFLNQDTRVSPGWLSALLEPLRQFPTAGLATSRLLLMSRPGAINMCGQDIHFTGLSFGRGFLIPADSFSQPEKVSAVSGASFAIRRDLWQRLGGFDEGLFMYYEDTDLSWRAQLAGYSCLYVPGSLVYHDYRPAKPGYLTLYYTKRNRYLMLLKAWRWPTLLLISPSLLLAEGLEWAHAALVGRVGLKAKLRASLWLLTHLPDLLRSRRQAQKDRQASDLSLLESCVDTVTSLEFTGGKPGRAAIAACNLLFRLNYRFARLACSTLKL